MRGKKLVINTAFALLEEFVAAVCGFILPRLIMLAFGSKYNGLTTSITQFLSCAVLLRSGIGGATRAALYKPIAEKDQNKINEIMKATSLFMQKIGLILLGAIVAFACVYPSFVKNEFDWFFTFSLFIIIGLSTFAESFFGITYLILLQADNRVWVSSFLKSIGSILNTVLVAVLVYSKASIHMVKLGSAIVFVIIPIVLNQYVKRRYSLNLNVKPDNLAIKQRWSAFWHQVASFAMSNTSIIVLTLFTNMLEVSVFSVYNMVANALKKLVFSFSSGIEAAFGNMIVKNEKKLLGENLSVVEWILYSLSTVMFTCSISLIVPFVKVYTKGIEDVNYIRPAFSYVLLIAFFFACIRIPYQMVVQAAGHYKQTRNGAIFEAVLNLAITVLVVLRFGLIGVAVGMLAATVFRTLQYSVYICKNLVEKSIFSVLFRIAISFAEGILTLFAMHWISLPSPEGYFDWVINAMITFLVCSSIVVAGGLVFYMKDVKNTWAKVSFVFKKKKGAPTK